MAHNKLEGNVIGEIWRGQEAAKEIIYFKVSNQVNWFRIEYTGDLMLVRANYMAEKLKLAASAGSGIEVGVDYDALAVSAQPPNTNVETFNLVKYIQIRA
jgi:hypothetical protein